MIRSDEEGDGPRFTFLVDLEIDALGRIWVADLREHRIHVFDGAGTHVRSIGGKGGGPREFDGVAGMAWGPDGGLWVVDGGNQRFAVYDTAGNLRTTHPRKSGILTTPWRLGFDAEGRLYDQVQTAIREQQALARHDSALAAQDTFVLPPFEPPVFQVETRDGMNRRIDQVMVPFAGFRVWEMDPRGYVWVGVTDRYRLERHRFSGGVDLVVERQVTGRAVSAEDRRLALSQYEDFERKGGRIDPARIPGTHTVFDGFFLADDGHLWVKRSSRRGEGTRLDVFDPRGTYLGEVHTTERLSISPAPAIRGDLMAAVVTDDDHVPSVVILRIRKPAN